jgi:hypothetical protein
MLGRVVIAVLAFIPLLVVVLCMVPALILWPFVPITRVEIPRRIDQLIKWTNLIIQSVTQPQVTDSRPALPIKGVIH